MASPAGTDAPRAVSTHPPPAVRVLLIDDQQIVGESVSRMLADHSDVEFRFCARASEAVEEAQAFRPTVVLLDLVMPVVDGLTVLRFLRASPSTSSIPVIVLSTKDDPAIKAEAFALSANDYLVKLPSAVELLARVRHHSAGYNFRLERDAAHRALEASHGVLSRLHEELQRRNDFIQQTFGRYINDDVVTELLDNPRGLALGGAKVVVSVLMSDLRGFTSLSERLTPEAVVQILNLYLGSMAEIVMAHGGIVDEFIGDAILAVFGVPVATVDHARRAVRCAIAMQNAMPQVNELLARRGLPALEMGIAVNTGGVVAGNLGSERRAKYGVVGSQVNLTARIESNTVGGQVLVSEGTVDEIGAEDLAWRDQYAISAKGFPDPIQVFDVQAILGPDGVALPQEVDPVRPVDPPRQLTLWPLHDGALGTESYEGRLLAVGHRVALVRSEFPGELRANVRLLFAGVQGEAYGKVVTPRDTPDGSIRLRFTSLPPEIAAMLAAL